MDRAKTVPRARGGPERALKTLRVLIDARPLSNPHPGGYRSALLSLLEGLREHPCRPALTLLVDRALAPADADRVPDGCRLVRVPRNRILADTIAIPAISRRMRPDIVHGTSNYLPPGVREAASVSVFDTLLLHRWPWSGRRTARQAALDAWWRTSMRRSLPRAACLLVPCRGVATEVATDFGIEDGRVHVVAPGLRSLPGAADGPEPRARRVVLLGGSDPRKRTAESLPVLAAAMIAGDFSVDVVGLAGTATRRRFAAGIRVHRHVDDGAWGTLLAAAATLVFPSLREGFGLPPLEAMRAGVAVVAGREPHLPETLGDIPFPCDPTDPDSLMAAVRRSLDDTGERRERIRRGRDWAARHTPCRQANETVRAWESVA